MVGMEIEMINLDDPIVQRMIFRGCMILILASVTFVAIMESV